MGLSIHGPNKSYRCGYSALHQVRHIALLECGWPKSVDSTIMYMIPEGITAQIINEMIGASTLCGFMFPNLMLHSDCDGTYTKRGKINTSTYQTGNSSQLLAELNGLYERVKDKTDLGQGLDILKDLKEVISDIVENGTGKVFLT